MPISAEEQAASILVKEAIADKKAHFYDFIKSVCDADETHRKHMGLQPGKFEEYVVRQTKAIAKEIENLLRAHERRFPD